MARPRNRRRSRHSPAQSGMAIVAILVLLGVLVSSGGWVWHKNSLKSGLDVETLCPKAGPVAKTVVLIDRTDGLGPVQVEAIRRLIRIWAKNVPKYGAFKIYEVKSRSGLSQPVVSVCNPGDGRDQSQIDSSPAMVRRQYEEKFSGPVNAMLEGMTGDVSLPLSPIMEAVQAASVLDFGPDNTATDNQLIIVSDLLQNVPGFNLLHSIPDMEQFEKTSYAHSIRSDFSGVNVQIYRMANKMPQSENNELGVFWIQWFERQGTIAEFKQIPGGNK